jgi:hypothetical protein
MSEALRRISTAVADVTEEELAALLSSVGVADRRRPDVREVTRTPLPPSGGSLSIQSEVEWV